MKHPAFAYSIEEQLATVEADTSQDLHGLGEKANMKHWLSKVQVAKVSRTVSHIAGTRGATSVPVNAALPGVHQSTQLRSPILIHLRVLDSSFCG